MTVALNMDHESLLEHRRAKDQFFATSGHSPLDPAERAPFAGLNYYNPNPALVFDLVPEPADVAEVIVQTSDGQQRVYRRAAVVGFEVSGQVHELTLYETGHPGFFIPFRDETSGRETYGAGRYLDIEPGPGGSVVVDFNLAYNPYCAYSDAYSCPLPPHENWLAVAIPAGEKDWTPGS